MFGRKSCGIKKVAVLVARLRYLRAAYLLRNRAKCLPTRHGLSTYGWSNTYCTANEQQRCKKLDARAVFRFCKHEGFPALAVETNHIDAPSRSYQI